MEKKLYRNEYDKVVAGVSSGLADYLQIDTKIVRLLFVLSIPFLAGTGLLVYIVLWILVPVNNDPTTKYNKFQNFYQQNPGDPMFNGANAFNNPSNSGDQTKWNTQNVGADFKPNNPGEFGQPKTNDASRTIGGLILLIIGLFLFLRYTLDIIPHWFNIWKIWKLWPLAIIAIGISLIFRNQRKTEWEKFKKTTVEAQNTTADPVEEAVIIDPVKDAPNSNS